MRPAGRSTASRRQRARSADAATETNQSLSPSASSDGRHSERGRQPDPHADGRAGDSGIRVGLPPGLGVRRASPPAAEGAEGRDTPSFLPSEREGLMRADGTPPPARADAGVGGIGSPPDRPAQPAAGAELPSGGAADRGQRSTSGAANCGASSSSPQSPIGTPAGDAESRRLASHPSAQATAGGGAQCELSGDGGFPPLLKTSAFESGKEEGPIARTPMVSKQHGLSRCEHNQAAARLDKELPYTLISSRGLQSLPRSLPLSKLERTSPRGGGTRTLD